MRLKIINRLNNRPFATPFKRSLPAAASQDEKVHIHSVMGDKEANWQFDRYKVMVIVSIVSVLAITGGIVWLASGGGENASAAGPYPTGELDFSERKGTSLRDIPYPSVKNSDKRLVPESSADKTSKTIAVTPTEKVTPTPTATPTPTSPPNPTPTPTQTQSPTEIPTPILSTAPSSIPAP